MTLQETLPQRGCHDFDLFIAHIYGILFCFVIDLKKNKFHEDQNWFLLKTGRHGKTIFTLFHGNSQFIPY